MTNKSLTFQFSSHPVDKAGEQLNDVDFWLHLSRKSCSSLHQSQYHSTCKHLGHPSDWTLLHLFPRQEVVVPLFKEEKQRDYEVIIMNHQIKSLLAHLQFAIILPTYAKIHPLKDDAIIFFQARMIDIDCCEKDRSATLFSLSDWERCCGLSQRQNSLLSFENSQLPPGDKQTIILQGGDTDLSLKLDV